MKHCLLAIDLSYQTYRAAAAHPNLTSGRHFTGGIYGFVTTLAKTIRETQATHLILCKDSKPYVRSVEYPEYKTLRKKAADPDLLKAMKSSLVLVTNLLLDLGLPILEAPGYESDDIIAHCLLKHRHRFTKLYAASNDSDLFQLLKHSNIALYVKDIASCHTGASVFAKLGITPEQHALMTAITGTHNDVAGVFGVGDKTAIKAIKDTTRMLALRKEHGDVIDRNLKLIELPHATFPRNFDMAMPGRGWFNERDLYRLLSQYDIETTASMIKAFSQVSD
jgi:DNA polymerase I